MRLRQWQPYCPLPAQQLREGRFCGGLSVRCSVEVKAKSRLTLRKAWLLIPVSILMGIGMWYYFDHVGVAAQVAKGAANNSPRGNLSDLYPRRKMSNVGVSYVRRHTHLSKTH